jgi:hypothetical protein
VVAKGGFKSWDNTRYGVSWIDSTHSLNSLIQPFSFPCLFLPLSFLLEDQ